MEQQNIKSLSPKKDSSKVKILYIAINPDIDGIPKYLLEITKYLPEKIKSISNNMNKFIKSEYDAYFNGSER